MSLASPPKRAVLAGGSGYLGSLLANSFTKDGWQVFLLTRSPRERAVAGQEEVFWDGNNPGRWTEVLEGSDCLVNLSGRSVDCRYTPANRQQILDSRLGSTRALIDAVSSCTNAPKVWLNASSMALYGEHHGDGEAFDEYSPTDGKGFLEEVTQAWESVFFEESPACVRKICLRISFVLGRKSGAFPLLAKFARLGLGGSQGSGKQWMSWIHEDDFVQIVRFLIRQDKMEGAINLAAPTPLTNSEFMHCLRRKLAPLGIGFPAPAFAVKMGCFLIGSAPELALQSRKVRSQKLVDAGYSFLFPGVQEAVRDLVGGGVPN